MSDGGTENELTNIVYIRVGEHDLGENSFFAPTYHMEIVSHEPFVRYTYDAVGNRTSEIKDDGSIVTYTYNAANLLKTMITTVGNEIQQSDTYTYYLDGNVESIKDKNNAETIYTYDSLGRIKSEKIALDETNQCMISYTYDSAGNRATKESNGTTTTYTYDENNRLTTEATSVQAKTYTYDANGNQLDAMVDANYAGSYKYDLWNMQVEYSLDGVGKVYYTYRPDGLRRSVQGRVHIWDSGNIIADIGTETVYYIRVLTLIYAKKGETKTYYRFNGHGDVIALANSSGAIIKRYKYDSFGVEENPGIFDTNVFRYCGEYYDAETKTIYLRARYYDAETGQNTSLCLFDADIAYRQAIEMQQSSTTPANFSYDGTGFYRSAGFYPSIEYGPSDYIDYNRFDSDLIEVSSGGFTPYGCFVYKPAKGSGLNPTQEDRNRYKNCYTFAIGYKEERALDPRQIRNKDLSPTAPVRALAKEVCADMEYMGRHGRILNSIDDEILENEYRIALRIDTSGTFDYHFMVQNFDGRWAEKKGIEYDSVLHEFGWTPENLPWEHYYNGEIRYYDSEIIYIAITM